MTSQNHEGRQGKNGGGIISPPTQIYSAENGQNIISVYLDNYKKMEIDIFSCQKVLKKIQTRNGLLHEMIIFEQADCCIFALKVI